MNILIISSPRTGSTVLQDALANAYHLTNLRELQANGPRPGHPASVDTINFVSDGFVIKLMFSEIWYHHTQSIDMSKYSHVFYTYRSNSIDQLSSYCLAMESGKWGLSSDTISCSHKYQLEYANPLKVSVSEARKLATELSNAGKTVIALDYSAPEQMYSEISKHFSDCDTLISLLKRAHSRPKANYSKMFNDYNRFKHHFSLPYSLQP